MTPPKVFISHSRKVPANVQRAEELTQTLRRNGIDATIDSVVAQTRVQWREWMKQQVQKSGFILMVCTEDYLDRVEDIASNDEGLGVAWEWNLIMQEFYEQKGRDIKVICVLWEDGENRFIPQELRGYTHYQLPRDLEKLLRELTEQPDFVLEPLGMIPTLPPRSGTASSIPAGTVTTPQPSPTMPKIDRFALFQAIENQLNDEQLNRVISTIPKAKNAVPSNASFSSKINTLLDWSETVEGPGLEGVYKAVGQHFQNFTINP